jgi:3-hydroxyisobutyrate dehydrogenase
MKMKVAVLGIGTMGAALAEALMTAGHEVIVYNRTRAKAAPLVALGATAAATAAEAIAAADASIVVLLDAQGVRELLLNDATRNVLQGKKLLNASTTQSEEIVQLAQEVAALGGTLAEVSIMIGPDELRGKEAQFMLGCSDVDAPFWEGILSNISTRIDRAGVVGAASNAETPILLTSVFGLIMAAYAAAVAIKLDIPKSISEHYIPVSAPGVGHLLPNLLSRRYDQIFASVENYVLVSQAALNAAKSLGLPTTVLQAMQDLLAAAQSRALGQQDGSAVLEVLLNPNA